MTRTKIRILFRLTFLAMLPAALGLASSADAGLTLSLETPAGPVSPGSLVDVPVFLVESGGNDLTTSGLIGAGVTVDFNRTPAVSDPAQVLSISANPELDPLTDLITTDIQSAGGGSAGAASLSWFVLSQPALFPASGSSRILIGTFHFRAGATPDQVTELRVGVASPGGSQFYLGNEENIDTAISPGFGRISVAVTAVPEPSSFLLAGLGVVLALRLGKRKSA